MPKLLTLALRGRVSGQGMAFTGTCRFPDLNGTCVCVNTSLTELHFAILTLRVRVGKVDIGRYRFMLQ